MARLRTWWRLLRPTRGPDAGDRRARRWRVAILSGAVLVLLAAAAALRFAPRYVTGAVTVERTFDLLRTAVLAKDFAAARQLMSEQARQQWWLDGLAEATARVEKLPPEQGATESYMFQFYRQMLQSATLRTKWIDDDRAGAEVVMWVTKGENFLPAVFQTLWARDGDHWRLQRTVTDLERALYDAAQSNVARPQRVPYPGYPPPLDAVVRQPVALRVGPQRPVDFTCPPDMAAVPAGPFVERVSGHRYLVAGEVDRVTTIAGFCLDLYEASRPSATAWSAGVGNEERATSRPGVLPWVEVSWRSAKQACERAGKRLCTGEEWQKATGGPEGWLYLDSHEFDADRCNTYHPQTGPRDNAPTGSFPRCISPFGAYDLCGNVSEWTDETWQDGWPDHVIRGGSYNLNRRDDQGLYPFFGWRFTGYSETVTAVHHHTTNMNFSDDGFRCCADPQH